MAGVQSGQVTAKLKLNVDIQEGIRNIVASEGGKVDASLIQKKIKDKFGKSISRKTKIVNFVKEYMSDDFEVTQEGSVAFINFKTKSKYGSRNAGLPSCKRTPPGEISEKVPINRMEHNVNETGTDPVSKTLHESHQDEVQNPMIINKATLASTHILPNLPTSKANPTMSASLGSLTSKTLPKKSLNEDSGYQHDFPSLKDSAQTTSANHSSTFHPLPGPKAFCKTSHQVHDTSSKALGNPSEDAIKLEVDKITDELSEKHYVEVDIVMKRLLESFQVKSIRGLGCYRRTEDIPRIRDLLRKQREVSGI